MIINILLTYFLTTFSLLVITVMLKSIDEDILQGVSITLGILLLLSPVVLAGCGIYALWS